MKNSNKTNESNRGIRNLKKGFIIAIAVSLVLVLGVGTYFVHLFNQFGEKIYLDADNTANGQTDGSSEEDKEAFGITDLFTNTFDEPMNLLVLGIDAREGETIDTARTDTIMLVTIHPDTKQVATVSFPRDTYIQLSGYDYQKINSAMYYGGVPLLKATIEDNFDLEIDHYFAIDFTAFEEIVDVLGGIDVYTPSSMYYVASDIHVELTPGTHHLNGKELLGYVRYRHDAAGDIGRIKRQQFAIRALGEKATELKSMVKAPKLLEVMGDHIYTDLNKTDLLSIIKTYRNFSKEDWHPLTLNGEAARHERDNLWYYFYKEKDRQEVITFVNKYLNGK